MPMKPTGNQIRGYKTTVHVRSILPMILGILQTHCFSTRQSPARLAKRHQESLTMSVESQRIFGTSKDPPHLVSTDTFCVCTLNFVFLTLLQGQNTSLVGSHRRQIATRNPSQGSDREATFTPGTVVVRKMWMIMLQETSLHLIIVELADSVGGSSLVTAVIGGLP